MKANEAPEKIYVDANEHWHRTHSVFTEKAKGNDIEYTRTDAFIEKACAWLEENADMFDAFDTDSKTYYMDTKAMVEQFVKAMKL